MLASVSWNWDSIRIANIFRNALAPLPLLLSEMKQSRICFHEDCAELLLVDRFRQPLGICYQSGILIRPGTRELNYIDECCAAIPLIAIHDTERDID